MDDKCRTCGGPLMPSVIKAGMLGAPSGVNAFDCLGCGRLTPMCGVSADFGEWFYRVNVARVARWAQAGVSDKQTAIFEAIAALDRELKELREMAMGRRLRIGWGVEKEKESAAYRARIKGAG